MSSLNYHNTGIQIVLFLLIFKNVAGQFFCHSGSIAHRAGPNLFF